jgi:hypothetical protein
MTLIPAAFCTAHAADEMSVPKTATPRLAIVVKVSEVDGTITCSRVVSKPVFETKTRVKDKRTEAFTVVHRVAESRLETFSLLKASFHDAQGNPLIKEAFAGRVRSGDVILVSEDGKAVDHAYMRALNKDVVAIIPPEEELSSRLLRRPPVPPARKPTPSPVL